jgi:ribulose-5-phosphate 4-epimerase/fuculose-1-phosphate aldolase
MTVLKIPSMKDQCTPAEWRARVDLAACYRLIEHYGMADMMANHISSRVPGEDGAFLINAYGMMYEEITASSLITIDIDGNTIFNPHADLGINKAGYVIHSAVHAARRDVGCVIHTHTRAGMAVSAMKCGLLPLSQTAMRCMPVTYHDYEGPALDLDERVRLVKDLGQASSMILRNHGLLTASPTAAEAFNTMYSLEMACKAQVDAMAANTELTQPPADVVEHSVHQYQPTTRRPFGLMEWPAMLRYLDRRDRSWRD